MYILQEPLLSFEELQKLEFEREYPFLKWIGTNIKYSKG